MIPRPIMIATTNTETSTATKRTLFRIALCIAMVGSVIVSALLCLQSGLSIGRIRHFIDIGQLPLPITSALLAFFALLSVLTFVILTIGLIKVKRNFAIIAAGLLIICSLGLITFSIWSFLTISGEQLQKSINDTLVKELDQTQYILYNGNNITIDNTVKMARLEKQHQCCGLAEPIEDYLSRQPSNIRSAAAASASSGTKGRTTQYQKNPSTSGSPILLPISCCNEKYRSNENNLCLDVYGNNSNPINRYNTEGCLAVIAREKFQRIQKQGFIIIVTACLAVISCIALAAVIRLLNEGYQVVPLPITT
ncbi:unnamed protein product [Rotaria socialis]|uniref:Tetraspanin n=1 Tax=Rotaria socialis TaxID=392032 RepID=A0A817Y1A2_9BILA|nr:unnamed protein product [Rotaria socialis]CAF3306619.1 unnamed protein product [Rotaria socialis]CAF3372964.1 unnamed protein product [Rotaria socialis]CAF3632187.1 unnamed protein product [Rotaria socialis]CAF4325119.1 unnamed protein product [Rotaria socialis]